MSKHVLSNNIGTGKAQPYTKTTHEWYNAMITENVGAIMALCSNGDTTNYFRVFGAARTVVGLNQVISAGAVYYNGEIYLTDSATIGIGLTIVGTITTTYDANDPILFTDGNTYNVHQTKKIVWSSGLPGSADVDFNNLVNYNFQNITTSDVTSIQNAQTSWTALSLAAGDITNGGAGSISGKSCDVRYKIIGKTLHIAFNIVFGRTGVVTYVDCNLGALLTGVNFYAPVLVKNAASTSGELCEVGVPATGSALRVIPLAASNFADSGYTINGVITLETA